MQVKLGLIGIFLTITVIAQAQLTPGVRIGLNLSRINGPSEKAADGTELETTNSLTGFMIGPSFAFPFTDNFGIRGEFLYSKKGVKYEFNGPITRTYLQDIDLTPVGTSGTQTIQMAVNNVNMDIPIMAYGKIGKLELSGGLYASLLFSKVADGELKYSWTNQDGSIGSVDHTLTYNYNRNEPGGSEGTETITATFNSSGSKKATLPKTLGAYYDYTEDKGNKYRFLDYGATVGASVYLSSSLFIGGRLQYGLADLTNNNADLSIHERDDQGQRFFRNDKDTNFNWQIFVGFNLR